MRAANRPGNVREWEDIRVSGINQGIVVSVSQEAITATPTAKTTRRTREGEAGGMAGLIKHTSRKNKE